MGIIQLTVFTLTEPYYTYPISYVTREIFY
nr:MAG TPA: hypothetical protein [Caudoviricetes sp.]